MSSSQNQNPLPKMSKVDGYSYYIEDDYFESNMELSGKNNDTFKFNRPTFASSLTSTSKASGSLSNSNTQNNPNIIFWDKDGDRHQNQRRNNNMENIDTTVSTNNNNANFKSSGTVPVHTRHNIDDLLEELASESTDGESGSESNDETLEQYYARVKTGINSEVQKMARKSKNMQKNRSAEVQESHEIHESNSMEIDDKIENQNEPKSTSQQFIKSETESITANLSTADEIMQAADATEDSQSTSDPKPLPDPTKSKKQQEEDLEFYELYHGSKFGLHDNLYDDQLDDEDEKFAETNKLTKPKTSDAILSCGKCFSVLTYDCQRHVKYENQFRAMFVQNENVKIVPDKIIKFRKKEIGKDGKRRRVNAKQTKSKADLAAKSSSKPETQLHCTDSQLTENGKPKETSPKSTSKVNEFSTKETTNENNSPTKDPDSYDASLYDHYFQVVCGDCQSELAYYDREEVYHFYNVIAS